MTTSIRPKLSQAAGITPGPTLAADAKLVQLPEDGPTVIISPPGSAFRVPPTLNPNSIVQIEGQRWKVDKIAERDFDVKVTLVPLDMPKPLPCAGCTNTTLVNALKCAGVTTCTYCHKPLPVEKKNPPAVPVPPPTRYLPTPRPRVTPVLSEEVRDGIDPLIRSIGRDPGVSLWRRVVRAVDPRSRI